MCVRTTFGSVGLTKGADVYVCSDFVPFLVLPVEMGYEYMWFWPRSNISVQRIVNWVWMCWLCSL